MLSSNNLFEKRNLLQKEIKHKLISTNISNIKKNESKALLLLGISNWLELSYILDCSPLKLEQLINHPVYIKFFIPKRKGKPRAISQPNKELMRIQRRLNIYLQAIYSFQVPDCVHGFIPKTSTHKRSIISNASAHIGKKHILSVDLKDYFQSIKASRIKTIFTSWGLSNEISTALTLLCVYEGCLPTGAPTSPVLANICTYELDQRLIQFSKERNITYTRYADDLTFSSNIYFYQEIISYISILIQECKFQINTEKLRLTGNNKKQKVTGIIVNEKLSVDRTLKKKIRARLHDIERNGISVATKKYYQINRIPNKSEEAYFMNNTNGLLSFIKMVEQEK
jgi:RNA-directed DNA polymerase